MIKLIILLLSIIYPFFASADGKILFQETFDYLDGPLPSHWWSEGNVAEIKEGRLFVDADTSGYRVSTIWLDREFTGDIRIEFAVYVVSSSDTANNINCFFMYSSQEDKPMRKTKSHRMDGAYNNYHSMKGYIITFLTNGIPNDARVRFRDNPGFHLLAENYNNECHAGKTYQIKIEKRGDWFQFWVNGKKLLDEIDQQFNARHDKGFFGFRTWHTSLWWDNLLISRLE